MVCPLVLVRGAGNAADWKALVSLDTDFKGDANGIDFLSLICL